MKKQLRDGLVLRSLSAGYGKDRVRLRELYAEVYDQELGDWDTPEDDVWVDRILAGEHPTITDDDIWVVVDPAQDERVVSSTLLIPQTWRYDHIELPAGRPELVVTHPDYRNRGLIRALMDVAHERSEAMGHVIQGITGIPNYYRRFGYTMAADLELTASLPLYAVPKLKEGEEPQFTLRPVKETDFPQLNAWCDEVAPHFALMASHSLESWRYIADGPGFSLHMIVDRQGTGVGYVALRRVTRASQWLLCLGYVVGSRSSYLATYDDVIRGMAAYAQANYGDQQPNAIGFLGGQHPALMTLIDRTGNARIFRRPYTWYLRVSSPARLIRTLKPVLEQRLVNSGANGYTGELTIDFMNLTGLRLRFEDGCIAQAEDIRLTTPKQQDECEASFPDHTFLNVVFGHRTCRQLEDVLIECRASRKAEVLLNTLFPLRPTNILAI